MKVKDLTTDLIGVKVKIPKNLEDTYQGIKGEMYIYSWWQAGIWLKKSMKEERIYPFCIDPKKLLNFEVVK